MGGEKESALGGRGRWKGGDKAEHGKRAHTCSMAPLDICMSAWSRDALRGNNGLKRKSWCIENLC
jgi:hypothetical protein